MDEGQASWTQPYYSTYLKRYIISYLSPVYKDGVMVAIIGVDLDFQPSSTGSTPNRPRERSTV